MPPQIAAIERSKRSGFVARSLVQSEGALRAAAAHCYKNAQALYEEAQLLYEEKRYPRAAALAVIGAEEFGKAIVYVVAALLPDQRPAIQAERP